MNLGIEDSYVFAALVAEGRLDRFDALRRPTVSAVMRRVERLTEIPRGRSWRAKAVRVISPLLSWLLPVFTSEARRFILGLDHEVQVR